MTTTRLTTRLFATLALTFVLGLTAACGDDSGGGSSLPDAAGATEPAGDDGADEGEEQLDREDAMLRFAQCMRENGIDMPDPKPGGGVFLNGEGVSPDQMEKAEAACQKWMEMAMPQEGAPDLSEEEKQAFLDMAACMRARGYDFPDPTFDGGRVTQRIEKPEDGQPGPEDPAFEQDREECSAEAGMEPPGEGGDGGSLDEQEG